MTRHTFFNYLDSLILETTTIDSPLSRRAKDIVPFEVMQIIEQANALERQGVDVIHLEVGEPKFPTAPSVLEAVQRFLANQPARYTEAAGMPDLRQAISDDYQRRFNLFVDPNRIIVTQGASAALLLAMGAIMDPGDEILMADPAYPCNRQFARFVDAKAQLIPAGPEQGYQLSAASIRDNWGSATRAALVASPSNPTGTVVSKAELARMQEAVAAHHGHFIVDEIYQGLSYQGDPETAVDLPNTWVVNSFSKYAGMTGWRLGWLVCPEGTQQAVTNMAQHLYISPSQVSQIAGVASFEKAAIEEFEARRQQLKAARDYLIPALESLGFVIDATPAGAYYLFVDVRHLAADAHSLAQQLLTEAGVATTPGNDFGPAYAKTHLRIAYVDSIDRLELAIQRMRAVLA